MKINYEVFMLTQFHTTGNYEYKLLPVDYSHVQGHGYAPNRYRFDTREEAEECIAELLTRSSGPFVVIQLYTKA